MNTTTRNAADLETYLAAVRAHLADLPDSERDDLLEDLEQHLAEVAAESGEPLSARLGPADAYAAELRSSAGLAPPETSRARTTLPQSHLSNAFPQRQAVRDQPGPERSPWGPDFDPDLDHEAFELHEDAGIERRRFGERPDLTVPPLEDTAAERERIDDESPSSAGDGEPDPRPRQE